MYIKSIVLDGFKSYGNRVEITGFDPEFNAITGLNGTGKSNILDSICFVLGITNLSNVRAGSLQELIYKHGQAGITKATVSITFDNRDKKQCPIGYENHDEITVTRQVVMGGKNKYLINGINVQNKRVSDLFCSVQLNVNNPHFLIMQGRITKVLNMKPPEILSMVEEAAGTRMYEAKKQAAQKTIEKKDAKLRELNDIIREDIAPKLQKLQDERAQFQEYQKVVRELENLTRLHVAWRYVTAEENAKEAEKKVAEVQDDIASKKESIKSNERQALELDERAAELSRRLAEEGGAALGALEAELQARERAEAAAGGARRAAHDALAAHHASAAAARRAQAADDAALRDRRDALDRARLACAGLREAQQASAAALDDAQRRFLAVSSGLEGDADSLQDRLIAAKQEASEASTRISQSAMEKKHAEARLSALEKEFASSGAQFQRDRETIDRQQAEVDRLRGELDRMGSDEGRSAELEERVRGLSAEVRRARDRRDGLAARLQRCDFAYSAPAPDFDRGRVLGPICKLIDVCDPAYCTALETAAGGRLFNVVVDSAATSQLLLQRGQLRVRTTLVPLDRIRAPAVDARAERAANDAGDARPALSLVSCSARVRPAVAWALGGAFAARSLDAARRVAFHPGVRRRCVTLDGDAFDPAGTLSGGARASAASVLLQLQELARAERDLRAAEAELARCEAELAPLRDALEARADAQRRFELMSHELQVVRARLATTAHAQLHAEIETLRAQVAELTAAVERDKVKQKETAAQARELEAKVKDIKGHREREFKKAEAALKKAKQDAEKHGDSWQQRAQELEALQLEVGELEAAVASAGRQLQEAEASAAELQAAALAATDEHAAATASVKETQLKVKQHKAEMASRNGDIARLAHERERLGGANAELELAIKELEYRAKELQGEAAEGQARTAALRQEHPWVGAEREFFGAPGGLYDFEGRAAAGAGARLAQLRARRERLARGLNARAHALLGREEDQFQDVVRKRRIVEADRAKLVQVMAELDDKKRATLVGACAQVNRDFGAIFGCLLPGAQARLAPAGASVLDGLEVKVGFNGAWKESLGELSGGQRSLVALSLVLAMLLFKPAPLYILDEVDAALDLAHTQNIGHMLRDHFRHSQFIIVSLKDGMFNNANVLFRTKFTDGMSSVQRTVNVRR